MGVCLFARRWETNKQWAAAVATMAHSILHAHCTLQLQNLPEMVVLDCLFSPTTQSICAYEDGMSLYHTQSNFGACNSCGKRCTCGSIATTLSLLYNLVQLLQALSIIMVASGEPL